MTYRIAPLFCRPWTLNGISPRLIESHYEQNYGSALNRLNAVTAELGQLDLKSTAPQVFARLAQEQTSLLNSTLLHELYFASLGGEPHRVGKLCDHFVADDRKAKQIEAPRSASMQDTARLFLKVYGEQHMFQIRDGDDAALVGA